VIFLFSVGHELLASELTSELTELVN